MIFEKKREKKGFWFKNLLLISFIIGGIFFFRNSYASEIEQLISGSSVIVQTGGSFDFGQTLLTNNSLATTTYNISAILLAIDESSTWGGVSCTWDGVGEDCFLFATSTQNGAFPSGIPFAAQSFVVSGSQHFVLFKPCDVNAGGVGVSCNFGETNLSSVQIDLPPDQELMIWGGINAAVNTVIYGSSNPNSYVDGCFFDTASTGLQTCSSSVDVADIYFQIFQVGEQINTGFNYINLTIPQDDYVGSNFPYWGINTSLNATTTGKQLSIQTSIATTTGSLFGNTFYNPFQNNVAFSSINVPTSCFTPCNITASTTSININSNLPIGDYYIQVRAVLRNFDLSLYSVVATSSIHHISIIDFQNPLYTNTGEFIGGFATTTGSFFDQCNQLGVNNWQGSVCNFLAALFQPHDLSLDFLKNVFESFKTIFPFSIFFNFNQIVQDTISSGVTDLTLSVPVFPVLSDVEVVIASSTIFEDIFGTSLKNQWFEMQRNFIWIVAGMFMLSMIL